jgi:hypothetical protein
MTFKSATGRAPIWEMTSDAVYDELAAYLEDLQLRARRPMLLPLVQR